METLLLITVNMLFVPFLQEAEGLGRKSGRFPGLSETLKLAQIRKTSWLRPFYATLAVLAAVVGFHFTTHSPAHAGLLVLYVGLIQTAVWTTVAITIRKHASARRSGADERQAEPRAQRTATLASAS